MLPLSLPSNLLSIFAVVLTLAFVIGALRIKHNVYVSTIAMLSAISLSFIVFLPLVVGFDTVNSITMTSFLWLHTFAAFLITTTAWLLLELLIFIKKHNKKDAHEKSTA